MTNDYQREPWERIEEQIGQGDVVALKSLLEMLKASDVARALGEMLQVVATPADREFLEAVDSVLPRLLEFRPELVFFQSGVDGLDADALGRLSLTLDGLRERDRKAMECCRQAGIPLATTLGGGYAEPIEHTVDAHLNTFLQARKTFTEPAS